MESVASAGAKRFVPVILATLAVLACYSPAMFATYGIADDFPCLSGEWMGPTMDRLGRSLGGLLLTWSYGALNSISDLRYLRALSVLGLVILAGLVLKHLMDSGVDRYLAVAVTILLASLPPFQIYAGWAQVWYYSYAAAATYASYRLLRPGVERPRWIALGFDLAGVGVLGACLSCYQPAAMFFWFWIAVDVYSYRGAGVSFARVARPLGAFAAALLLYFAVYKLRGLQSPRAALELNVARKVGWFVGGVLPSTFRLQAFNFPSPVLPWIVFGIIAAALLIVERASIHRFVLKLAAFGGLLLLAYVPNLASSEYNSTYRTRVALSAIVGLFFWLGVCEALRRLVPGTAIPV